MAYPVVRIAIQRIALLVVLVSLPIVGLVTANLQGLVLGIAASLLILEIAYWRWCQWAVPPTKKIDLKTARGQLAKLRQPRRSVRWRAANKLRAAGPDCAPIVPELIALLNDADSFVRDFAASALGSIGPAAKEAVPALHELLKKSPIGAACGLGGIGPDARDAVPDLIDALETNHGNCRTLVAGALWKIDPHSEHVIPALVADLMHDRSGIRRGAALELGRIGPPAKAAVTALRKTLDDRDHLTRRLAREALSKIEPPIDSSAA